ncbi:hypothetical protein GM418_22055 [Maribellus comscasis]|uniref:Lipocalin-like domain-containing protein n=1 Tax=Maribellus comscasis TaxID=2681766 RepID=A0A6I6K116_9BACT|nr:hypothetical protein [Maribellus comscasis]QGY46247.1 hypothetical protein GM418_22055 [Maribellus comscasis]
MKPKILNLSVITLLLLLTGAGCKDDEPLETDPAQIILGKWEITYMGNDRVENPTGYKEYMKDSVLREYDYETSEYYYKKYSIDTLLHEYIYIPQEGYYMLFLSTVMILPKTITKCI